VVSLVCHETSKVASGAACVASVLDNVVLERRCHAAHGRVEAANTEKRLHYAMWKLRALRRRSGCVRAGWPTRYGILNDGVGEGAQAAERSRER
jgi:hypothetical protein